MAGIIILGNAGQSTKLETAYARVGGFSGAATTDEISSAEIAATIAVGADLLIKDNVVNLADSLDAQVDFATAEGAFLEKPQVVTTDAKTINDITKYVVKEGDTVQSVAQRFNVTSDTIKWANDIAGDVIDVGKELTIPPVSGVLYTVKDGDTPESLAETFKANREQIVAFNDAEVEGLKAGAQIVIPDGTKPAPVQQKPQYFSSGSSSSGGFAFGGEPIYGGNGYAYGYCTWHAAGRRAQIGKPLPRNLGNAITWASLAGRAGFAVDRNPQAGDVLYHVNDPWSGGYGHVAFVEAVNPDGSLLVSDMNYAGNWGRVTYRTVLPGEFGRYLFIH